MDYQALKRQLDKLQEENVRMKVALRQLRTENHQLLTRSRKNTVSRGLAPPCGVNVEQDPAPLQTPEAFRIQLMEKERKMAAMWPEQRSILGQHQTSAPLRALPQSAGDAPKLDTGHPLAPLKKRMGMDRAHPLEPITVRKIYSNTAKEAESSRPHPTHTPSQPIAPPEADRGSRRARAEYMAWSIDSAGDNIMNFCKDLLLRAKAKEANRKVTEMSEILYYEGLARPRAPSTTDATKSPCAPEFHAPESNPQSTRDTSKLPHQTHTNNPQDPPQDPPQEPPSDPELLHADELNGQPCCLSKTQGTMETSSNPQKRVKLRVKRIKRSLKSRTARNFANKMAVAGEPKEGHPSSRRLLPVIRTCIPLTQSSGKPSQGPPGPSSWEQERHRPLSKPQLALEHIFRLLGSDSWEQKIEGLTRVRRLAQWHADILTSRLHDICLAVIEEVRNLRTLVSRAAVATLGDLCLYLQRVMDAELDWTAKALLQKAGESNNFIRHDVSVALGHMLRSCSPSRSMKALLNGGLRHRNVAVRECAAQQLEALVESVGTARLLCCRKDVMKSFLSAVSRLPHDASLEVRCCGQHIMAVLKAHQDFQKKMKIFT